jgi:dUTP pyrophosphatase
MQGNPVIEVRIIDDRLKEWGIPDYQTQGSAAIDLFACIDDPLPVHPQEKAILISAGMAISMLTETMAALVLPRSGLGHKKGIVMGNGTGLIDSDYQGTLFISCLNRSAIGSDPVVIMPGERIAQLMFVPVLKPTFSLVAEFSARTERGSGGFGSTGS